MKFFVILTGLCLALNFSSQGQNEEFLKTFSGNWKGEGQLFGTLAKFEMTWTETLGSQFIRLEFQNSFERNSVTYEMQAMAMYRFGDAKISGTWYDSRGQTLPLTATYENHTLTVLWGDENTEQGKTVYKLTDYKEIVVTDFVLKEGVYSEFGKAKYYGVKKAVQSYD